MGDVNVFQCIIYALYAIVVGVLLVVVMFREQWDREYENVFKEEHHVTPED